VIDDSEVRTFDLDGEDISNKPISRHEERVHVVDELIILILENTAYIYNGNSTELINTIETDDGSDLQVVGDWIVAVDKDRIVTVYDLNGEEMEWSYLEAPEGAEFMFVP
jgi:hypothetical protein